MIRALTFNKTHNS